MTSFSTLSLYALTVKPPSATQDAISGDFIGNGQTHILSANGSRLTLYRVSEDGFKELFSQDVFGIVRRISKFRLAGSTKDHIVITTDSGRLVTYEYKPDASPPALETVHFETFGKSQVRRVVPGEYLATDPKGRAIMIASTEKNKLVYTLTRSAGDAATIAISSPLEAHRPQTLTYCLIGLDVGYDNPMFAAIELDYSSAETDPTGEALHELQKELVYYELDLGLNHIVRKWSEPIDRTANILFSVPGGKDAPSGVLCCGEDNITYRRIYNNKQQIHRVAIPRREGATEDPNRKRIIVAGTQFTAKKLGTYYLLQTDDGDVFQVTYSLRDGEVDKLKIKFFDTLPIATSICVLRGKAAFVFVASESGDRSLYQLLELGDQTNDPVFDSLQFPNDPLATYNPPFFRPRPLVNLSVMEGAEYNLASLNPIMDMEVANPGLLDAPQIYTVNGESGRSTFRTTKNALNVIDLVESELPLEPTGVWTTKLHADDESDQLIVLTQPMSTLVLRIADEVVNATNTGFILESTTLGVQQWGDDCILQIHPNGIRHIQGLQFSDDNDEATAGDWNDWPAPQNSTIVACASNTRQVAVATSAGEIYYFECDVDGSLSVAEETISLPKAVKCMAIPDVPEGNLRAYFMAVGCDDQTIRVFNLTRDMEGNLLTSISVQGLSARPTDLTINYMMDKSPHGSTQYLHIGLENGVYIRSGLDDMTGEIGDTRKRFLGPGAVTFARVTAGNKEPGNQAPAVLAMCASPWLAYTNPTTKVLQLTPINYAPFRCAWSFHTSELQGIICVSGKELHIFSLNDLHSNTTFESIPLRYTPRKLVGYHQRRTFYVIESENNTMGADVRKDLLAQDGPPKAITNGEDDGMQDVPNGQHQSDDDLPPEQFGYPRAQGRWASCIQVVSPVDDKAVVQTIELTENRSAVSVALVYFESEGGESEATHLAVGIAKDLRFAPSFQFSAASIMLYKISPDGRELEFLHETEMDEPPLALMAFKGRLAVGSGTDLALYECGMRSLLRKALKPQCVPTRITGLKTQGNRLVVSDQSQSITYVVHKDQVYPNLLLPFADDTVARHTTCTAMLDYETTVGGDKFGNIWLVRCPPKVSEASDESPDGLNLVQDKEFLGGAPKRLDLVAHYFANDIPVAMQRTQIISGGDNVVFWAGLQGTLGALIPFSSRRQYKMFQQLELALRNDDKPISGRDHLAYRSYYNPVKSVIDGDLIERFLVLGHDKRESLVGQLTGPWTSESVDEAIWNMRAIYVF